MYENRFLCGVEGVNVEGSDETGGLLGGVCALLVPSILLVPCAATGRVWSGDNVGGVAWGIECSNSSFRSSVEYVRFASSAAAMVNKRESERNAGNATYSFESAALRGVSASSA